MKRIGDIAIKKKYGQHFLRWQHIVDEMVNAVKLNNDASVMEIGCGDGFLTRTILRQPLARLRVYEIDEEWAEYVRASISDKRLEIFKENILDADFLLLESCKPWILLANLPYQITFPILFKLKEYHSLFSEGVVMVQEEVAQKIVKTSGRGYGFTSLFFQHYFDWKLMSKIPPQAFQPAPKVHSRLLYFRPKLNVEPIVNEHGFWKFIKMCFHQPRRTLKNNLAQSHCDIARLPTDILSLRAQQLTMKDLLSVWNLVVN